MLKSPSKTRKCAIGSRLQRPFDRARNGECRVGSKTTTPVPLGHVCKMQTVGDTVIQIAESVEEAAPATIGSRPGWLPNTGRRTARRRCRSYRIAQCFAGFQTSSFRATGLLWRGYRPLLVQASAHRFQEDACRTRLLQEVTLGSPNELRVLAHCFGAVPAHEYDFQRRSLTRMALR